MHSNLNCLKFLSNRDIRWFDITNMLFHLHPRQSVVVDQHRIYFRHHATKTTFRGVILKWRHLQNLHDIVRDLETFKNMKYYPLGEDIWANINGACVELVDNRANTYFRFFSRSWHEYITRCHRRIYSFFRHGSRGQRLSRYQHDENVNARSRCQPGRRESLFQQHNETLPRAAGNAHYANEQRTQCANISSRSNSNSRQHEGSHGRGDAKRDPTTSTEDNEYEQLSSDETGDEEYSCQFSIEEGDFTEEDNKQ